MSRRRSQRRSRRSQKRNRRRRRGSLREGNVAQHFPEAGMEYQELHDALEDAIQALRKIDSRDPYDNGALGTIPQVHRIWEDLTGMRFYE